MPKGTKGKTPASKVETGGTPAGPAGDGDETIYFWRETDEYGYMSQWAGTPFRDRDDPSKIYKTAEHYMMHHKALLFGDTATAATILTSGKPRAVKALGRAVANFDDKVWTRERERVVREGNYLKFTLPVDESAGGETLRNRLLATGNREVVEASPFDAIWGVGFGEKEAPKRRDEWGLNLLGKALMDVREMLRKEDEERAKKAAGSQ